jgi:hypothetical protein
MFFMIPSSPGNSGARLVASFWAPDDTIAGRESEVVKEMSRHCKDYVIKKRGGPAFIGAAAGFSPELTEGRALRY